MQRFQNILAAVDLTRDSTLAAVAPESPSGEAVERALWLAKRNSARLTFFYAADGSASTADDRQAEIVGQAKDLLQSLTARASAEGVAAEQDVRIGKSWIEIIRQVLRGGHDLVVAGTRRLGPVRSALMGSTGMKLLRKCPCPVWITQPQSDQRIQSILVAHCLRPVGDTAMEVGRSLAQLHGARLHVLHSLEFLELASAFPERIPADKAAEYRANAERHIQAQLAQHQFAHPPQVHILTDAPDFAILNLVEAQEIELAVMGTIARTGIPGFITGNTAERLLPLLPCSVLAVKPSDFVSPVSL
jgi:universal stress protein E